MATDENGRTLEPGDQVRDSEWRVATVSQKESGEIYLEPLGDFLEGPVYWTHPAEVVERLTGVENIWEEE